MPIRRVFYRETLGRRDRGFVTKQLANLEPEW